METHWDVIIVGARCAGATLGALLGRAGARTLLIDAAPRGSDMPMSTHLMQPPGMAVLDRLGVGDPVRAVTPPTRVFRAALDEAEIFGQLPDQRPAYCVRRSRLDPLLQNAAEGSGVEFRDRHRVVELIEDADRVTGVVVQSPQGRTRLKASLVVGADGPHSTVARLTRAEEYLGAESTRGGYWAYFPAPRTWTAPWDATLEHRGTDLRYVFRCDGDQIVVVAVTSLPVARSWGKQYREKLLQNLAASPTTAPLVAGHTPIGNTYGVLKTRYFYRRPIGPGFALVGDAGHFKDFVTGQGMTDALLDAERLSSAIVDGRDAAFEHFWRSRDVETLPLHFDALRQGRVGYNEPFMRWVFAHAGKNLELSRKFGRVADRSVLPAEFVPMRALLGWMGEALVRGRFDVLRGFMAAGKELSAERRELDDRRALANATAARLAALDLQRPPRALPASARPRAALARG